MTLHELLSDKNFRTAVWETLAVVGSSFDAVQTELTQRPFAEPARATEVRLAHFDHIMRQTLSNMRREAELKGEKKRYFLAPFDKAAPGGYPDAVFVELDGNTKRLNFDGPITNFAGVQQTGNTQTIRWYAAAFSEWMACQNPEFTQAYRDAVSWIPYAGIGVSTAIETADNLWVLTQRPVSTPNYPLTRFVSGGGWGVNQNLVDAFTLENKEELRFVKGRDYDPSGMILTYIGTDSHYAGGEHARIEIGAYVKSSSDWASIANRASVVNFEPDVAAAICWPTHERGFFWNMALDGANGVLLPSAEMTLAYGAMQRALINLGPDEALKYADRLMNTLNMFQRQQYAPPRLK